MTLTIFDIEVLPNVFLVCLYDSKLEQWLSFEISERVNQYKEMRSYFLKPDTYFIGFNSLSFDGPIMNHLIDSFKDYKDADYKVITRDCFRLSDDIINGEGRRTIHLRYKPYFKQIDLLTMLFSKALRVSLKEMEITMCYKTVQEMNHHWMDELPEDKLDELKSYCFNDVGATSKLLSLCLNDLKLRVAIQEEFKINCLSKDGVGIGVQIFTKFICEDMGITQDELKNLVVTPSRIAIKDLILPVVKFETEKFQNVLRWFQSINVSTEDAMNEVDGEITNEKKKYKKKVLFGNLVHTFALGGIHSENKPAIHVSNDEYTIRDLDVASYYPKLIIEWEIAPSYIKDSFLRVMKLLRDLRIVAKKAKIKAKDLTYKLAMNACSGNFKNKYSPFYSPESSLSMCINGQLMLAMLIEKMELAGFECIASNTDGATFKVTNGKEDIFNAIAKDWEKLCRMDLEETVYEKMVIYAVNDYIAYKEGYAKISSRMEFHDPALSIKLNEVPVKLLNDEVSQLREKYVKEKGLFISSPRLGKGMDSLIVSKALQNYFGRGIPVEDTIKSSPYIWDFIKFERVGRQFDVVWNSNKQQRTNRFYVSKQAPYLYKVKEDLKFNNKTGREEKVIVHQHLLKGWGVQIMNQHEVKKIEEYKINYQYYISQANALINELEPKQCVLF